MKKYEYLLGLAVLISLNIVLSAYSVFGAIEIINKFPDEFMLPYVIAIGCLLNSCILIKYYVSVESGEI